MSFTYIRLLENIIVRQLTGMPISMTTVGLDNNFAFLIMSLLD